jgi:hypothetical protein
MTNETKLKIIQFIRKLLKYNEPIRLYTVEKRTIQKVRFERIYPEEELFFLNKHGALKPIIILGLMDALKDTNAIEITQEEDVFHQGILVTAELKYILP